MSIIIHFNTSSFIPSAAAAVPSTPPCLSEASTKLEMVPGIEHTDGSVMTDDESSAVDIATSNSLYAHPVKEARTTNHGFGSCFGLPYQDHNYGAPPPPTPPSFSPCPSPVRANGVPDEDTNLSVVSVSTTNEETQEGSITRCICGYEHDDEYMICCDLCLVWQHVDCMGLDRSNIPDTYLCEKCEPRKVDRHKAKVLQTRKKVAMTVKPSVAVPGKQQELQMNTQFFRKDFRKKGLQTSEEWKSVQKSDFQSVQPISGVQKFCYTSDSDEENTNKSPENRPKTRSKRKKKEEENIEEKIEQSVVKRSKSVIRNVKDRMDLKRSKVRRTKNKESTSTADEEAQDAWEYSLEWCENHFEVASNNQYTPEIQHISRTLFAQGHEKRLLELLRSKQCHVMEGSQKRLICIYDLPRDQPLIEYKGKFLLASQFLDLHPLFNKRLYPFVLFYSLPNEEICVDASVYGNDARYVRRSCKPNAEIRHIVHNGNLHLYLSSSKVIFKDDEVTIPFDLNQKDGPYKISDDCACDADDCQMKPKKKNGGIEACHEKKKRGKRLSSIDDENSVSLTGMIASPPKPKTSPLKNVSSAHQQAIAAVSSQANEHTDTKGQSDLETEEQAIERKRKMTREERKIDAIMRAFDRMEKEQRRRQQALERQKAHHPKVEDFVEKTESVITSVKEEEKNPTTSETQSAEEEKVIPVHKTKKSKRRRGSGTPSRRRTRTSSGGSDILCSEESGSAKISIISEPPPLQNVENNSETAAITIAENLQIPTSLPPASPTPSACVVLKPKRNLLHEWRQKSEATANAVVSSPVAAQGQVKWTMSTGATTCYVRCTKDNPHSGGISAAHLRRNSSSGHIKSVQTKSVSEQGSAKKRWLRQAMYDSNSYEDPLSIDAGGTESSFSPVDNSCLSPNSHIDASSPVFAPGDTVTPLKKRRLMRESVESVSSPRSPIANSLDCPSIPFSRLDEVNVETNVDTLDSQLPCDVAQKALEDSESKVTDFSVDVIATQKEIAGKTGQENCSLSGASSSYNCKENINSSEALNCKPIEVSTMQANCDSDHQIKTEIQNEDNTQNVPFLKTEEIVNVCTDSNITKHLNLLVDKLKSSDLVSDSVVNVSNEGAHTSNEQDICETENIFAQKHSPKLPVESSVNNASNTLKTNNFETQEVFSSCEVPSSSGVVGSSSSTCNDSEISVAVGSSESSCVASNCDKTSEPIGKMVSEQSNSTAINCKSTLSSDTVTFKQECNTVDCDIVFCPDSLETNRTMTSNALNNNIAIDSVSREIKRETSVESKESAEPVIQAPSSVTESSNDILKTSCASATKRRKVSLSEYRMRRKDDIVKSISNNDIVKKSSSSPAICATALPETLPEQVTLAPLPLFDVASDLQSPSRTTNKNIKKKKEVKLEDKDDVMEHRENLTERLKREFGFDDESDSNTTTSHKQSKSISSVQHSNNPGVPVLPLCAQPPPPPPPPPPRLPRPSTAAMGSTATAASSSQFSFPVTPPFPRPPFLVTQVPGAPYITTQPSLPPAVLPPVHQMNPPGAQCGVRPPLLPSPHSFTPSIAGTVLRPPVQHEYATVNAQNFAALVQQPPPAPPPPPHKAYPHVYQSSLYK